MLFSIFCRVIVSHVKVSAMAMIRGRDAPAYALIVWDISVSHAGFNFEFVGFLLYDGGVIGQRMCRPCLSAVARLCCLQLFRYC